MIEASSRFCFIRSVKINEFPARARKNVRWAERERGESLYLLYLHYWITKALSRSFARRENVANGNDPQAFSPLRSHEHLAGWTRRFDSPKWFRWFLLRVAIRKVRCVEDAKTGEHVSLRCQRMRVRLTGEETQESFSTRGASAVFAVAVFARLTGELSFISRVAARVALINASRKEKLENG